MGSRRDGPKSIWQLQRCAVEAQALSPVLHRRAAPPGYCPQLMSDLVFWLRQFSVVAFPCGLSLQPSALDTLHTPSRPACCSFAPTTSSRGPITPPGAAGPSVPPAGMGMAQQMPQMGGGMGNGMGAGPMGLPSGGSLGGGMGSGILGTASAASAVPMRPGSTPPMQQQQMQQHQMQQQQQQQQQGSIQMQGGVQVQVAGLPQLPVQVQSGLGVVGPMGQGGGSYGTGAGAGAGPSKPQQMMMGAGSGGMMAGTGGPPYAGMYWVPPQMLDSTQDSLLRPPAA